MLRNFRLGLARLLVRAAVKLVGGIPQPFDNRLYTCRGKGGLYALRGSSVGAGTCSGQKLIVYQDITLPADKLYHRTVSDFEERMELT